MCSIKQNTKMIGEYYKEALEVLNTYAGILEEKTYYDPKGGYKSRSPIMSKRQKKKRASAKRQKKARKINRK